MGSLPIFRSFRTITATFIDMPCAVSWFVELDCVHRGSVDIFHIVVSQEYWALAHIGKQLTAHTDTRGICLDKHCFQRTVVNIFLPITFNIMFWVLKRTVSPFREDFIFAKLRRCEVSRKLNPRENFQICSMSKQF